MEQAILSNRRKDVQAQKRLLAQKREAFARSISGSKFNSKSLASRHLSFSEAMSLVSKNVLPRTPTELQTLFQHTTGSLVPNNDTKEQRPKSLDCKVIVDVGMSIAKENRVRFGSNTVKIITPRNNGRRVVKRQHVGEGEMLRHLRELANQLTTQLPKGFGRTRGSYMTVDHASNVVAFRCPRDAPEGQLGRLFIRRGELFLQQRHDNNVSGQNPSLLRLIFFLRGTKHASDRTQNSAMVLPFEALEKARFSTVREKDLVKGQIVLHLNRSIDSQCNDLERLAIWMDKDVFRRLRRTIRLWMTTSVRRSTSDMFIQHDATMATE